MGSLGITHQTGRDLNSYPYSHGFVSTAAQTTTFTDGNINVQLGEGANMEELYKTANRLVIDVRGELEQVEAKGEDCPLALQEAATTHLNTLSKLLRQLEQLLPHQPPKRRELWRIRIQQMTEDCTEMRGSLGTYLQKRQSKQKEEEQRRQLFEGVTRRQGASVVSIDGLYQEADSLRRSNRAADEIREMGSSILSSLGHQNDTLKSAQRKMLDIANTLNLSRSVMRIIERKHTTDKLLVYGGMIFILVFMFVLWYYFG